MPDGRFDRIPPPIRGSERGGPSMAEDRPTRTGDTLMQMGGRKAGPQGGQQQAVQLVMQAADMLMQAGQLDPIVAPVIQQVMQVLQQGLSTLGGPGAGGPPSPPTGGRRRRRRPRQEGSEEMGGEETMM